MKAILLILFWSILFCRMSPSDANIIKVGGINAFLALVIGVVGLTAVLINSIECLIVSFMHVDANA